MTIPNETISAGPYEGNGVTTSFSFAFKLFAKSELRVVHADSAGTETDLVLDSDYSATLNADQDNNPGGSITYPRTGTSYLPAGETLTLTSNVDNTQTTQLPNGSAWNAKTVERMIDKCVILIKQMVRDVGRALRQPISDTTAMNDLPTAAARRAKFLYFTDTADAQPTAAQIESGTVVTAAWANVVGQATLALGRAAMGFSSFFDTLIVAASAPAMRLLLGISAIAAKGDLLLGSAADTLSTVTVGADGTVLTADSTAAAGVSWQAAGFTTGDGKLTLKTAADTGWVMADDGTIGSASSGATTRANADTEALYTLLWTNVSDTYAPVTTGRGASAAADFAANKPIALTKQLGRAIAIAGAGSGLTARALGETLGEEEHILTEAEMPSHVHTEQVALDTPGGTDLNEITSSSATDTVSNYYDTLPTGGDQAHNNMQPSSFWNVMIKL